MVVKRWVLVILVVTIYQELCTSLHHQHSNTRFLQAERPQYYSTVKSLK